MKRLNNIFLEEDLKAFLKNRMDAIDLTGNTGSFQEVSEWLEQYDKDIENFKNSICKSFEECFPEPIIQFRPSCDDSLTYIVDIFGLDQSGHSHILAFDLARSIENELNGEYIIIPSFKNIIKVEKHYPEIYKEFMRKKQKSS